MINLAAIGFSFLAGLAALFQAALVIGVPWGGLTLGGKFPGKLSLLFRIVAAVSGLLLVGFALIVLTRAGLALGEWYSLSKRLIWIVVGYCVLGVIANAATRSRRERLLWLPVVAAMLIFSTLVALS